ncbi:putative bifunctional chitinase/lysozyme [Frondihabitans sp. 762G35]|uniref:chitinase n=1 Tax=Frondihabitans sp. 762G35 TaxID=1446794 RepID=UPI000D2247EE|nr:chitinase [Frondihabitans sp. 762G35]ARC56061.1 putative bifunctional chitinase/lysozyme [Frondihabitans sp. 762G35]
MSGVGAVPVRRLSFLRLSIAVLVTAALATGGVLGYQMYAAQASASTSAAWFGGYVDVTATPTFAFENPATAAGKQAVLSFVVSSKTDACTPSWGGAYSLDEASARLDLDRRIARLQQQGGQVAVSFGGQANQELAVGCTSVTQLAAAYRSVVERYDVTTIDLDVEGTALENTAANQRRAEAIALVQKERRASGSSLAVWLTLPVTPDGLAVAGQDAVRATLAGKVDVAGVNAMTMDYGASLETGVGMATAAERAVTATQRQLGILYRQQGTTLTNGTLWSKVGATPMLGQNDDADEVFTTADAATFNAFAVAHGLGRMSVWSLNRDVPCGSNYVTLTVVSDSCSGVSQKGAAFATALGKHFAGSIDALSGKVTTSEALSATTLKDDPETSPYAIWSGENSYLQGTKIVWHHSVYQAKWWTQGDVPDNPVLNSWQTPWQLIGPVLKGEKPIPQPTLPAGTYPDWAGTATYSKGARVLFDGTPYQAKWWTQGDSPAAASSNADGSPWVPLTLAQIDAVKAGSAGR